MLLQKIKAIIVGQVPSMSRSQWDRSSKLSLFANLRIIKASSMMVVVRHNENNTKNALMGSHIDPLR